MNDVVNEVAQAVENAMPQSDLANVGAKIAETVLAPTPALLVEDLIAVHKLAMDVKDELNKMNHPTLWQIFHAILCS